MQSVDSIETYANRMKRNLACRKEEITCDNIIKQQENVLLWLYYKEDTKDKIQIDQKFLTIHIEY